MAYSFLQALRSKGFTDDDLSQIFAYTAPAKEKQTGPSQYIAPTASVLGSILGVPLGPAGVVGGGAAGAALGKLLSNRIDSRPTGEGVGKEALIGGVSAGVGEALNLGGRAALGAIRGAAGRTGINAAGQAANVAAGTTGTRSGIEVLSKLLSKEVPSGKLATKAGQLLEGAGEGVATRSVGATASAQREFNDTFGKTVAKALQENNALGATADDFAEKTIRPLQNEYTQAVASTKAKIPTQTVIKSFDAKIAELSRSVVPQSQRQAEQLQTIRDSIAKNFSKKGSVSASELNSLKTDFQLYATPSIKINDPTAYNVNNFAASIFRDAVNDAVATSGQKVAGMSLKDAGKKLNELYSLADVIERGQFRGGRGGISFRNLLVGGTGYAAGGPLGTGLTLAADTALNSPGVAGVTSRILSETGRTLASPRSLSGVLASQGLAQGAAAGLRGNLGSAGAIGTGRLAGGITDGGETLNTPAGEVNRSGILGQLLLSDLEETGGKNIDKLLKIAPFIGLGDTTKPKAKGIEARKVENLAKSGLRALDEVESTLQKDFNVLVKSKATLGLGTRQFDSALFGAVEALLRARSGAAVPEQEVRRYMKNYAPRLGDTQTVAQRKIDRLRQDFLDALDAGDQPDQLGALIEQLSQ